jgi:hypothetical protein
MFALADAHYSRARSDATYSSVSRVGHTYHVSCSLGTFSYLNADRLIIEIKAGRIFPMAVLEGKMENVNDNVILGLPLLHRVKFLPFRKNAAAVIETSSNHVHLQALPHHIFQGTVIHKIEQRGHELVYVLEGHGPDNESWLAKTANNLFIALHTWEALIKARVIPAARKLDDKIKKEAQT